MDTIVGAIPVAFAQEKAATLCQEVYSVGCEGCGFAALEGGGMLEYDRSETRAQTATGVVRGGIETAMVPLRTGVEEIR